MACWCRSGVPVMDPVSCSDLSLTYVMCTQSPLPSSVTAMSVYKLAKGTDPQEAIRFLGCFTDGGCDDNQQQYWVRLRTRRLSC